MKNFETLFNELAEKASERPAGSGTVEALDKGAHFIGKKIIEEAGEVWIASEYQSDEELAEEMSRLIYWTQVMMLHRGITLDDIYKNL